MKIETISIDKLKPYEKNAKLHPQAQIEQIKKSIEMYGNNDPIAVWGKNNTIVEGHGRYLALKEMGATECDIIRLDHLTNKQRREYMLVHNKLTMNTDFDFDILAEELEDIDFDGFDFGFEIDTDYLPEEVVEDEIPEPPAEPKAKLGDLYQLGDHRLICGDSTDANVIERLMGGCLADMVFTDPPWNVAYGEFKNNPMRYKKRTILNDSMSTEAFKDFMTDAFSMMGVATKAGAIAYVVMSAQEWGNLMLALDENNFHWSSTIIWNKDHMVLSRKDYHTKYEPIWYGWKDDAPRLHPLKDRKQSDVWDFDRPIRSELHPTMKPVALVARAVTNSSNKGDAVLDLFGGSGTTLMACEQLDRRCFMSELDPKYVDVIIERWEQHTGKEAILL